MNVTGSVPEVASINPLERKNRVLSREEASSSSLVMQIQRIKATTQGLEKIDLAQNRVYITSM
jgi:hypothetical protein